MKSASRRRERRADIVAKFARYKTLDLTDWEKKDLFLEGTGSVVIDWQKVSCGDDGLFIHVRPESRICVFIPKIVD